MLKLTYDEIIAIIGLSIWFLFPIGMFISLMRQDREALPSPKNKMDHEPLKIFEHKKMLYDDSEELEEENSQEINDPRSAYPVPHEGIGSSHGHHFH